MNEYIHVTYTNDCSVLTKICKTEDTAETNTMQ